jgi:hypothetical protein
VMEWLMRLFSSPEVPGINRAHLHSTHCVGVTCGGPTMHTAVLILAGYVGFAWAAAALWVGWSLLLKSPHENRIEGRS